MTWTTPDDPMQLSDDGRAWSLSGCLGSLDLQRRARPIGADLQADDPNGFSERSILRPRNHTQRQRFCRILVNIGMFACFGKPMTLQVI
jgi:hypothetical protein